jgi:hypothetical protein
MIEKRDRLVKDTIFICDFCRKEIQSCYCSKVCYICGRHVCEKCGILFEPCYNLIEPNYDCDHPDIVCKECWQLGEPYRKAIQIYREAAENKEEELWKLWKEEVKVHRGA